MNSKKYQGVLREKLFSLIYKFYRFPLVFQHDNAHIYVSRFAIDWLEEQNMLLRLVHLIAT